MTLGVGESGWESGGTDPSVSTASAYSDGA